MRTLAKALAKSWHGLQRSRLCKQSRCDSSRSETWQHHVGKFGETIVVDWGLAKAKGSIAGHTPAFEAPVQDSRDGESSATVMDQFSVTGYMAPEQANGRLD